MSRYKLKDEHWEIISPYLARKKKVKQTDLADETYNSKKIKAKLTENNSKLVSPTKKNALNPIDYDKHLYKELHIIECYFKKIKEVKRIAT